MNSELKDKSWIFEPDGSLLDIYVQETDIEDWLKTIDFLNENFELKYGPDHLPKIDKEYSRKYLSREVYDLEVRTVSFVFGSITFNCHFFLEGEIEIDFWPDQIIKKEHLDTVIEFMKSISKLLKKEVILTPENTPSNVLIAVNFRNQIKIFSKQEYKQSIGKPLSVFQRLRKVYSSCLFGMLKFVSIEKVKNILAGHIIEVSGANRKHVASRKNKSVFD